VVPRLIPAASTVVAVWVDVRRLPVIQSEPAHGGETMATLLELQAETWWGREVVTSELTWLGDELCRRTSRPADAAGDKGNASHLNGGHRSQEWILNSRWCTNRTYTVQSGLSAEQLRHIAAFDFGPGVWGTAENRRLMVVQTGRLIAAAKAGRLAGVRQIIGTLDGKTVIGYDVATGRTFASDLSHLDHWHLTFDRRQMRNRALMERIVAIALGEDDDVITAEDRLAMAESNWKHGLAPTGPDGTGYNMQDHVVRTEFGVADLGTKVNVLVAAAAADETRDRAALAAITALATAGGVDAAPIVAAVKAEGEASRTLMTEQHQAEMASLQKLHEQQLAEKTAEIAALQAELAALGQSSVLPAGEG